MIPPDLNDPAQRAAYRAELRGVAKPLRYVGLLFVMLGLALALARRIWFPELPALIPLAAIALGVINMMAGVVARTRYHQARMKGD